MSSRKYRKLARGRTDTCWVGGYGERVCLSVHASVHNRTDHHSVVAVHCLASLYPPPPPPREGLAPCTLNFAPCPSLHLQEKCKICPSSWIRAACPPMSWRRSRGSWKLKLTNSLSSCRFVCGSVSCNESQAAHSVCP